MLGEDNDGPHSSPKKLFYARRLKHKEAMMAADILKTLDSGNQAEVYQQLKRLTFTRNFKRKDVIDGLQVLGISAGALLLGKTDDIDMSLIDHMFLN